MPQFDFDAPLVNALSNSSGNAAAATATATLTPPTSKNTCYLAGFMVSGLGATSAGNATVTISGVVGGSHIYYVTVPAGVTVPATPLAVTFPYPIAATGPNIAIVVTLSSFGAGNTNANCAAFGFFI